MGGRRPHRAICLAKGWAYVGEYLPGLDHRGLGIWKGSRMQGFVLRTTGSFTPGCSIQVWFLTTSLWCGETSREVRAGVQRWGGGAGVQRWGGGWTRQAALGGEWEPTHRQHGWERVESGWLWGSCS